ncbi:uncharacterized protein LOC5577106 [Aedes aegypti]|uniref:ER-bound oxygenase mpaB/mpaB'/Rubber oxygenase catalytic domain-containing protein n=1 Tax=Aedes aegypti TaxID=7159 RepID=A0A6I8TN50_AEDAE|nr:uncharacterized protein LOC5577106 [Aedes aegypti]
MHSDYMANLLAVGEVTPLQDNLDGVTIPTWFNEQKFKRAQHYFRQNFAAIYYGTICGLLASLSIPSILNALVFSTGGKPSFRVAARRYLGALKHTVNWYCDDLASMKSGSWQSLNHVRQVHSTIQRRATARNYRVIISQRDMAITQFAFIGFVILEPSKLGAQNEPADLDAMCHFWRVLGYLLGMEDKFNLCDSDEESRTRMRDLLENFIKPSFEQRTEKCEDAYRMLLGGLWCFNVLLDYNALAYCAGRVVGLSQFAKYWYKDGDQGSDDKFHLKMGWKSRVVLFVILSIHEVLLKYDLFRYCFNTALIMSGQIAEWFYSQIVKRSLEIILNYSRKLKGEI